MATAKRLLQCGFYNSARLTTPGGSFRSRYKSLYCQLTEADHTNLQGLASDLYRQNADKYKMLKPPNTTTITTKGEEGNEMKSAALGKDFCEIHECTVMYGCPELADHLSGSIYMRASIYEDKCSQGKKF